MCLFGGYDLSPNFQPLTVRPLLILINGGVYHLRKRPCLFFSTDEAEHACLIL